MKKIIQFILSSALVMTVVGCNTNSKTYTIKFVNEDETVLQQVTVNKGVVPEYTGETPRKVQNAEYTYSFSGWSPQIVAAKSDATYTAMYENTKRKYTITFNNNDGTLISSSLVEYGTMPAPPEDPVKGPSAKYDYSFSGWDKEIVKVTGDETYTATYHKTIHNHLITFLDDDGTTVLKSERFDYGEAPTCDIPTKPSTISKVYEFSSWSPAVEPVYQDQTYTAQYSESPRKYTITFLDEDGITVLKTEQVEYGTTPTCNDPKKPSTETNSFLFNGWSPAVLPVTGEATYTATYQMVDRLYEITFVDDDGNLIDVQYLNKSVVPTTPNTDRADDDEFAYTFTSWDKSIVAVTADTTYTANYSRTRIGYNFDKDNLDSYIGASLYDVTDSKDVTAVMGDNDGATLPGTGGKYLQYKATEAHMYKISLPKIDFRNLQSLSSSVKFICSENDVSFAFTKALAQGKAGITVTESQQDGRIEIVTTAENKVEVKLNINPNSSTRITKTFNDSGIYKGTKSIEFYMYNTGGAKYFTIDRFAPRRDKQYQINKDRVLAVNDTYSWAACYIQMVVGSTFLPADGSAGKYSFTDASTIQLYRNNELVTNAVITGTTAASAFTLSEQYFTFGSGGSASEFNWMARILSSGSTFPIDVFQNDDVLVMKGSLVGVTTATSGYGIDVDLSFEISIIADGYQDTSPGLQFTLL